MDFQRARSEDQIQNRIQEIVDAVSSIYSSVGYEGLNFSIISKYTKFTRPSIYKYFKTKDEILLVILKDEFKSFVSDLITSFKINKLYSLYEISEIWTDRFIEHKKILDLYSILYTAIEKNVSLELLVETKKELNMINSQLADFIGQLFPSASNDSVTNFIASMLSLAGGIYSMSNLSDLQLEAIKLSGLDYTTLDFKKEFMASIYQQMYCLKNSIEVKKE